MHHHDGDMVGMEAFGSLDVPVVRTPEELTLGIDPLDDSAIFTVHFRFLCKKQDLSITLLFYSRSCVVA